MWISRDHSILGAFCQAIIFDCTDPWGMTANILSVGRRPVTFRATAHQGHRCDWLHEINSLWRMPVCSGSTLIFLLWAYISKETADKKRTKQEHHTGTRLTQPRSSSQVNLRDINSFHSVNKLIFSLHSKNAMYNNYVFEEFRGNNWDQEQKIIAGLRVNK